MRYPLLMVLCALCCLTGTAATIHVPSEQPSIQAAIDSANENDVVIVAPGTYFENINFLGKSIHVISSQGPSVTTINGNQNGSVVYFQNGEGPGAMLSGFTVRNGTGTREPGGWVSGGGIYCIASSPVICNNIFFGNSAEGHGAGIGCLSLSGPTITDNFFYNNINGSDVSEGWGGGIGCRESSVTIRNNILVYNSASYAGGAIFCKQCPTGYPIIENNRMSYNRGKIRGGALYISYCESLAIANNTFSYNTSPTGGGFHFTNAHSAILVNNTFFKNSDEDGQGLGGGIFCNADAALTVVNTILWENSAGTGPEIYIGSPSKPSTLDIMHSDVMGGANSVVTATGSVLNWGAGMIDDHPLFLDSNKNDFHISFVSECRESGIDTVSGLPSVDYEEDPRKVYSRPDIGADEFCTHIYYKGNAEPGEHIEFTLVGTPGAQPLGFWLSVSLLAEPIPTQWGNWMLDYPLMGPVMLTSIPNPGGTLTLPATIPPDSPAPIDLFVQAMIGNELSNVCTIAIL